MKVNEMRKVHLQIIEYGEEDNPLTISENTICHFNKEVEILTDADI